MQKQLSRSDFVPDFKWGVSTAAFQIEGSFDADGKGPSIWDVFSSKRSKLLKGGVPGNTCDFYKLFESDLKIAADLNVPNFRFSLSWPRIFPSGIGKLNSAGVDFYNRVIDCQLQYGIEPWVTLYHWDLPNVLELKGGWTNRDILDWFSEYAGLCGRLFGDRVKNWIILNEPSVFTGAGYFLGIHAPGRRGINNYSKAVHHSILATAEGARALKAERPASNVGTTYSATQIEPNTLSIRDVAAAKRVDTLLNRMFIEPMLGMGYPMADLPVLRHMEKNMHAGDVEKMAFNFDFVGLQCYTREVVRASWFTPYIGAALVKPKRRGVPTTQMDWEVYPEALYQMIKRFSAYPNMPKIIVTESGAAFPDSIEHGKINDSRREQFLYDHIDNDISA